MRRLLDLLERARHRRAPRPHANRVRCTVERLESRLVLSSTDTVPTDPNAIVPQPAPTGPVLTDPNSIITQPAPTAPVLTDPSAIVPLPSPTPSWGNDQSPLIA
jgi:hypothetical protein